MKYYLKWKLIQHKSKVIVYNPRSTRGVTKRLYEDYKWRSNLHKSLGMKFELEKTKDCTFSPKINHNYQSNRMRESRSLSKLTILNDDLMYQQPKSIKKASNSSMRNIFSNINYADFSKGSHFDKGNDAYSTYRHLNEPKKMKTINVSSTSTRRKDNGLMQMIYTPDYIIKPIPLFHKKVKKSNINHSNESTIEETFKGIRSYNDKTNQLKKNSQELFSIPSSTSHNDNNQHHHHLDYHNLNQITLQTLSDSKVLQLATYYITTDESLEKFKLNLGK